MSHHNELQDVLANIDRFNPKAQAKMRFYYPKIEAAQRKARTAMAGMMHVLNEPPISVSNGAYLHWMDERKNYVSEYDKAWKQYLTTIEEYMKAPLPACVCDICLPKYIAGKVVVACPSTEATPPQVPFLDAEAKARGQALLDAYWNNTEARAKEKAREQALFDAYWNNAEARAREKASAQALLDAYTNRHPHSQRRSSRLAAKPRINYAE